MTMLEVGEKQIRDLRLPEAAAQLRAAATEVTIIWSLTVLMLSFVEKHRNVDELFFTIMLLLLFFAMVKIKGSSARAATERS